MRFRILLLCSLLFGQIGWAQEADLNKLDAYFNQALSNYELPGMAVGIVKDGKVVFAKGYGNLRKGQKDGVSESSVFAIASLSKAFTAAAIGMLVDEGKLDWDDKVSEYLPHFKLHDDYITSQLTVRDLLCHRSGLNTFDGDLLWYGTNYTRKEILGRIRELPVKSEFRTRFGYQNIMFLAAGELITVVTGKSWDDFLQERVFNPLKMQSTNTTTKGLASRPNVAYPHVKGEVDKFLNYDNSGGAAAINSSVTDLCQWIQLWLNEGVVGSDTLLQAPTIGTILSSHTPMRVSGFDNRNSTHFKSYGLGWFLMDYQGVKVAHHGGGLPGFISKIALVPEKELGLIVLTNGETSLPTALMYKIIDAYTGAEERDWAGEYLGYSKSYHERLEKKQQERVDARVKGTKPGLKAEAYLGTYEDKMYGEAKVEMKDGKLWFTMVPAKELFVSEMEHWHYNTYRVKFKDRFLPDGLVTFELNPSGKVEGFTIDLPNPDFHFYNLHFEKQ